MGPEYVIENPIPWHNAAAQPVGRFLPEKRGMMATPGTYSVTMSIEKDGEIKTLAGPESFEVKGTLGWCVAT